jgi:thiol-disulfide isomerase/thioredoxin
MLSLSNVFLTTYIALWILVTVLVFAVFALYHHFGEMYLNTREGRASQGPDLHKPIRVDGFKDLSGKTFDFPPAKRATLVVYATTDCPLCAELVPAIKEVATKHRRVQTVVICGNGKEKTAAWADGLSSVAAVVPDPDRIIGARLRIAATPFLVAISGDGVVRMKGVVNQMDGLEAGVQAAITGGGG